MQNIFNTIQFSLQEFFWGMDHSHYGQNFDLGNEQGIKQNR